MFHKALVVWILCFFDDFLKSSGQDNNNQQQISKCLIQDFPELLSKNPIEVEIKKDYDPTYYEKYGCIYDKK